MTVPLDEKEQATATAKAKAKAKAKTKYRDLSTAAAKCAAFGRDDVCCGGLKENKQLQEQPQQQPQEQRQEQWQEQELAGE